MVARAVPAWWGNHRGQPVAQFQRREAKRSAAIEPRLGQAIDELIRVPLLQPVEGERRPRAITRTRGKKLPPADLHPPNLPAGRVASTRDNFTRWRLVGLNFLAVSRRSYESFQTLMSWPALLRLLDRKNINYQD